MITAHRVHVVPRLRRIGPAMLIPDWLAITIGRDIWTWRPLSEAELAHELEHVRQWQCHGLLYVPRYARASWRAVRAGGHWYRDNAFEAGARGAANARTVSAEDGHPGVQEREEGLDERA